MLQFWQDICYIYLHNQVSAAAFLYIDSSISVQHLSTLLPIQQAQSSKPPRMACFFLGCHWSVL